MTTLEIETTICKAQRLKFLNDLDDFLDGKLENYMVRIKSHNPIILKKGTV